jgi:hypothetical protein
MRKFWIRSLRSKRLFLLAAAAVFLPLAADGALGTQGASFLPFISALDTDRRAVGAGASVHHDRGGADAVGGVQPG